MTVMYLLPQILLPLATIGVAAYLFARRNRERARNAPLRGEIESRVSFATMLDRASVLGTGGFGGIRGSWIPVRGPKRLIVGTDAFMISAPQALREFVFSGRESSIALTRMPSGLVGRDRDWIVINGQANGRQVQLAITQDNLPDIWQALAATGAASAGEAVPAGHPARPPGRAVRSARYALRGLAAALTTVLIMDAAIWLSAIALPSLSGPSDFGFFVAMVMFLVWFYRARVNADGHDWPQRRSLGWAFWGWFIPVVNLWFPFQMMVDIWRAGLPAQARANPATLPGIWWACCLAFFILQAVAGSPSNPALDMLIKTSGVLAAIMTTLLVRKVSRGPVGQPTEPSDP